MKNNKHWLKPLLLTNFLKIATFTIILFSNIVSANCNFQLSGKSLIVKQQYENGICPKCNIPLNSGNSSGLVVYDCGHLEHEQCTNDKKECITCLELAKTAPCYAAFPKYNSKTIKEERYKRLPLYTAEPFNYGNCYVCNNSLIKDNENSTACANYSCDHIEHIECMSKNQCKFCTEKVSNRPPGYFLNNINICKHDSAIYEKFISEELVYDSSENLDFDTAAQQQKLNPKYAPTTYKIYKNSDELFMEGLCYICSNELCTKFMTKTEIDEDKTPCIPLLALLQNNPKTFFQDNLELLKKIVVNQFKHKLSLANSSFYKANDSKIMLLKDKGASRLYYEYCANTINRGKTAAECLANFIYEIRIDAITHILENSELFLADNYKYIYKNMFNKDTDLYISGYSFHKNKIEFNSNIGDVCNLPLDEIINIKNRTINFDKLRDLLGVKLYGDLIKGELNDCHSCADNSMGLAWLKKVNIFIKKFNELWGGDIPEDKQPKGILDLSYYCI
jgi:hypothetical protein